MKTTIRRSMTVIASAAALLVAAEASAADGVEATQAYCIPEGVSMQGGFQPKDGAPAGTLQLNNAFIEADGTLKLTKLQSGDASTAYYRELLGLSTKENEAISRPFHVYFSFSIEADQATGEVGSGLAFLAQQDSLYKIGANENALGYGAITPSLAIEFDTRKDPKQAASITTPDPQGDHIGFMLNGEPDEHAAYYLPGGDLAGFNGFVGGKSKKWFVWIDYTGAEVLVYLSEKSEVKPSKPIAWEVSPNALENPNDFNAGKFIRGMDMHERAAWFGFSAANYGDSGMSIHAIHEWELSNEGIPCACQGESACPESLRACSAGKNTLDRGICVECTAGNTSACDAKGEICNTGTETCGPCSKDADCDGHPSGDRCALTGPREGQCVECTADAHCPGDRPTCDLATNACIECTEDAQCPGEEPVCNPTSHTCEPCDSDADCSGRPLTPACAVSGEQKGMCVPKLCKACPEGTVCGGDACVPIDSIEGGGFACTASGSSGAASDSAGSVAGVMGALGIAAAVARRRRRSGKGA